MPRPLPPEDDEDDGPTAAEAASQARGVRGAAKLAAEAAAALAEIAEAVHARVHASARHAGEPSRGVPGLAYKTVRGVTRPAGNDVDTLLSALAALLPSDEGATASQEHEALLAALNGVLGDRLARTASPLAIRMAFRHHGRALLPQRDALAASLPHAGGRPLVLIHDLGMSDLQGHRADGHDHGKTLAATLAFTPVHVRYDSGLHVSTNGRALAGQLEQLLAQWPHPLVRFAIVAHGMGGLLARSALHHGLAAGQHWPHRLDDLACLGTPHHGAPLEGIGRVVETLLRGTPFAAPLARLTRLRGAGVDDLRHGNLLDEDWVNGKRTDAGTDRRMAVPLPVGTRCYAIAGATASQDDGLVPVASALGRHRLARRTLRFAAEHQRVFEETGHLQLLSSPAVAAQLCDWLGH